MMLDEGETGKNGRMGSNTGIFLIPFTKNNLCDILSFVSDTRGEFRIMYKILKKRVLNPTVVWMDIEAPAVAKKANPGQFIMLRVDENGERIPLTVAGTDPVNGTVKIIYQIVGGTTKKLSFIPSASPITGRSPPGMEPPCSCCTSRSSAVSAV